LFLYIFFLAIELKYLFKSREFDWLCIFTRFQRCSLSKSRK